MIKFFKMKDCEIRRAFEVDDAGNKIKCVALIGRVKELLEKEIIFEDCTKGNMDKWLVIYPDNDVVTKDYPSLADAKASIKI